MMSTGTSKPLDLAAIFAPVQGEIRQVEWSLRGLPGRDSPWMTAILDHIFGRKGKRLRPTLTLLVGNLFQYDPRLHIPMATAVEVLHTATLVHDDTIDQALVRRGIPTINSLWDGGTAVLIGDYLFATSAEMVSTTGNVRVMRLFAKTLMAMSRGELAQSYQAYNGRQSRQDYFDRIGCKTGALFSMATEAGAILGQAPEEAIQALKGYGNLLGIAFQIVDDILDFTGTEEELGKPVGSDLLQGTLTLPAILALERYPENNPVAGILSQRGSPALLAQALEMLRRDSFIEEAYGVAQDFCAKARLTLLALPTGPYRDALERLTEYVIERRS